MIGSPCERPDQEMGDPALVFGAELVRPIDAAHAEHRRRQAEGAGIVEHILVGGALGAAIGAVKSSGRVSSMPWARIAAIVGA